MHSCSQFLFSFLWLTDFCLSVLGMLLREHNPCDFDHFRTFHYSIVFLDLGLIVPYFAYIYVYTSTHTCKFRQCNTCLQISTYFLYVKIFRFFLVIRLHTAQRKTYVHEYISNDMRVVVDSEKRMCGKKS